MPVWLVAIATLLGSAIIADLPPASQTNADDVLVFDAPAFAAGTVVGLDLNPESLAVARDLPPPPGASVEWREASAVALPVPEPLLDQPAVIWLATLQPLAVRRQVGPQPFQCPFPPAAPFLVV